jgi:hypothetical protein
VTHVDHAWRHRPKALGGTDPIEFTSGGAFTAYRDCVLADPTTLNFWPCDDASGSLRDLVGGVPMGVTTWAGWPHFGQTGPFTALPEQTSVSNGDSTTPVSASLRQQSRFVGPAMPSGTTPFTLQGWICIDDTAFNGSLVACTTLGINVAGAGGVSASRGTGGGVVTLTGFVAAQGVWTHLRVDYDGTTLRLLQDFVLVDSDTQGSVASGGAITFLNAPTGSINWTPFVGRVALWSLHSGLAATCRPAGVDGGSNAPAGYGPIADGAGGTAWTDVATQADLDAHLTDTVDAHDASAISILDTANDFTATDVEAALAELQTADEADEAALASHLADTTDAHDASAISFVPTGTVASTDVQAAIAEVAAEAAGGSAHTIEDEGTALTQRGALNFAGAGVTATDTGTKTLVTIPGGGGGAKLYDYTVAGADKASIDTFVDGSTVANFTGYDVLEVFALVRTDDAAAIAGVSVSVNNDSGSNYNWHQWYLTNVTVSADPHAAADTSWSCFNAHGSGGTANYATPIRLVIPGYAGTTFYKAGEASMMMVDATAANKRLLFLSLGWLNTAAITRLKIAAQGTAKLKIGSRLIVYGR